jgi:hypothetical protein
MKDLVKDEDVLKDLQAILGGKPIKGPDPAPTPAAQAQPPPPQPAQQEFKNEHAIFDRIAANMSLANAYNLGSFDLEKRFEQFDREAEQASRRSAPAAARTPTPPRHGVAFQKSDPAAPGDPRIGNPDWPPVPAGLRVYTPAERSAAFGAFEFEPDPGAYDGDGIKILGTWESDNIVDVAVPQLTGKLISGRPAAHGSIRFHRLGKDALQKLWRDWESAGLLDRVISFQGGFASRFIRGTQSRTPRPVSNHAWGTAFDINAEWNHFGAEPALVGQTGCVRELVEIANQNGFFWGGHFRNAQDGMHFELAKRV